MANASSGSKLVQMDLSKPVADYKRNPRLASSYSLEDKDFKELVESVFNDGFRSDKPLVVSRRRIGDEIVDMIVQGHRRYAAAKECNKRDPEKCKKIPVILYEGLSEKDEWEMMIDHFHVKGLGDFEKYLAVRRLILAGLSEEQIARHIGMSRGYVQRRGWIAKAPQCVEDEFRKKAEGVEGYIPISDKDLAELSKATKADKDAGLHSDDGGPEFLKAWETLVKSGSTKPNVPKAWTRDKMLEVASAARDTIVARTMRMCAGDPIDLNDVLSEIAVLRDNAAKWVAHQAALQNDVKKPGDKKAG